MNGRINEFQMRLFYKLFASLPSIKKIPGFNRNSGIDFNIDQFYYSRKKDFWFTKAETEYNYYYLFGQADKSIKDIRGKDTCLIIDFDKNVQFNDSSLGLFGIKNSKIHILINNTILKQRYPNIRTSDFNVTNFKSFDKSLDLEIIDLGSLNGNFINNIGKLIKECSKIKLPHNSQKPEKDLAVCQICSKSKIDFKLNSKLNNLKNLKRGLCGSCIEKIVVSEFYRKIAPLLKGNDVKELNVAKEKFGNDQLFDIGIKLLEKYAIIKYIGVKKLFYTIDNDPYLVKKYIKYSDENNLLIDNILKTNKTEKDVIEENENGDKPEIPRLVKTDSFGNKNTIIQMNIILEDVANGKSEDEAIMHANVSKNTYNYWINRGKQEFGELYLKFYKYLNEIKSEREASYNKGVSDKSQDEKEIFVDEGIYEPILLEYEDSFNSMNETGIAWVSKTNDEWIYSRNINGKTINISADTISELYEKVSNGNLIWGIRNYDKAKEFIDFPDDFEIPSTEIEEDLGKIDSGIYKPLPEEYENSFSSMNQTGIAWVNQIGSKFYYVKSNHGKNIRLSGENISDLYEKVKKANQIWGIRDYGKAREFIDIPDDFEIPLKSQLEDPVGAVEPDPGIYAPLPEKYENSFSSMNQTGIAWVNKIGRRLIYSRKAGGKTVKFDDENIYVLYNKVKDANQIWGIRDYGKAREFIDIPDDFEIPKKQESEIVVAIEINDSIYAPLSKDQLSKFNPNPNNKSGIAWVNKVGNKWFYQRQRNGKTVKFSDSNIVKLHEKVINNNQIWGIIDIDKARKVIETNSIDEKQQSKPSNSSKPTPINSKVTVNYIEKSKNNFEILIKGTIRNRDLFDVLNRFDLFKENIKRIITNSINDESDIFIELEINKYLLCTFEEKIKDFGWKIIK